MTMSIEIEDLIARGVLFAKIGSRKMRVIQAEFLAGDLRDEIEHFEPYGFTSEAKPGAEVLATSIMGVVIIRSPFALRTGDIAQFHLRMAKSASLMT